MAENGNETNDSVSESRDSGGSSADSFRSEIQNDPSANSRIDDMMSSRGGLPSQFNNDFRIDMGSQVPELPGQDPNEKEGSAAHKTEGSRTGLADSNNQDATATNKEQSGQIEKNPHSEQNKNEYKDRGQSKEGQTEQNPAPDKPQSKEKATDANSKPDELAKQDEIAKLNAEMPVGGQARPSAEQNNGVWRPHQPEPPTEGERTDKYDQKNRSDKAEYQGADAGPRRQDTLGGKTPAERRPPDDIVTEQERSGRRIR